MLTKQHLNQIFNLNVDEQAHICLVYSDFLNERLNYTCQFIFNHVLGLQYTITNSLSLFKSSTNFKINYSFQNIDGVLKVEPKNLLNEVGISQAKPQPYFKREALYFYENNKAGEKELHFDIFSAVFYFISRYEEWQPYQKDRHGRFEAKASLLYQNQAHLKPILDVWILELKNTLQNSYPDLKFPEKKLQIVSTMDVDNLFAYKHKGFVRSLGASIKDIFKLNFKNIAQRILVLSGKKHDPFDVYEDVSTFCENQKIPLFWFFLFKTGTEYDRTIDPQSLAFLKVFETIKKTKSYFGLHPSYNASAQDLLFEEEIRLLSHKLQQNVNLIRQHFLRFDITATPHLMIKNGVIADFTMGYASMPGFRAGTSFPFYYYDFKNEKVEDLLFIPFCVMDGAFTIYENASSNDALKIMLELASEIKKVNGFFISVFHERTFSDHLYKGFGTLYKKLHLKLKEL